jgi:tetratricopeptide (TPR) repeat protein
MNTIAPLLTEAENALVQNELDRAAGLYARALELDEDRSPLPSLGLARVALLLGKIPEALVLTHEVLSRCPNSVEALTLRGSIEDAVSDSAEALRWYEKAVRTDGTYAPARLNLGRAYASLKRWNDAIREFRKGLELAPSQTDAVPMFAVVLIRAGQAPEAIRVLTLQLQRSPDHIDSLVTLADALVEEHHPQLAAELLANSCERLPTSPVLHARRSALALRMGNLPLARTSVDQQLRLTPNDAEAAMFAANLAMMALDFDDAERRIQAALAASPYNWRAHYQLGMLYEALRLRTPALVAYRTAIAYGKDAWEPRNNLASLLLEFKTRSAALEARDVLEQALVSMPPKEALPVRFNLALAYWQLGEKNLSERNARSVAQSKTPLPVVTEAKRFLKNFQVTR